jgi:hypothetical protein
VVLMGGVLLALVGLWLGHTIEYVRVWGAAGLNSELFHSMHAYMLPLAAILGLLASTVAFQLWRIWSALGHRLDAAHTILRATLRGTPADAPAPLARGSAPSFWAGILVGWPPLAALQILLYIVQENVEAAAAGLPAPGLGSITGGHALAPLVHAGVSLVLLIAAASILHRLRVRARTIVTMEGLARALLRAVTARADHAPAPSSRHVQAPVLLFGLALRQRPPPATPLAV